MRAILIKHHPGSILFAALAIVALMGGLEWLERALIDFRYRLIQRDATDRLVVVEIDHRSLRALNVWPWPRTHHAEVIDRLIAAGADTVAIDVDFSAVSNAEEDTALETALERAGRRVVLPAFKQRVTRQGPRDIVESKPLERFARHVTLGSIIVQPDADSLVRRIETAYDLVEGAVPQIPILLAANGRPAPSTFYIDYGIRIATIQRISYVDVLQGNYPPDMFRGRHVLVGATAVELGDQLAVPLHVTVPGTLVLALASDTLLQGRPLTRINQGPALVLALLILLVLSPRMATWPWQYAIGVAAAASCSVIAMTIMVQALEPIMLDSASAVLAPFLACLRGLVAAIEFLTLRIFGQQIVVQRQEEKLHQINEVLAAVLEHSPAAIVSLDTEGRILTWNNAAAEIFGFSRDEVVGRSYPLVPAGDEARFRELFSSICAGNRLHGVELRRRHKSGVLLDVRASGTPIYSADGAFRGGVYVFEDVTEKRKIEAHLRHAQKLEAIGSLTGGIAHDFNNLLTIVIGNLDLLERRLHGDPMSSEIAALALQAARQGAALTTQLLAFARRQRLSPQVIDVNAMLRDMHKLLERAVGDSIELTLVEGRNISPIVADLGQLQSAILNLAVNARDAMPDGGRLTLEVSNAILDDHYAAQHHEVRAGNYVRIAVMDTGTGIPPELIGRVFEPFFTTKDAYQGTGLGLSMVYGFIKQSGGHISVTSKLGDGTTFQLYLPRAPALQGTAVLPGGEEQNPTLHHGTESILVVEDNQGVRRVTAAQLRELGYRTLEAASGAEALSIVDDGVSIDLLISDISMPSGMSGWELVRKVRAHRPAMKALMVSGFPAAASSAHAAPDIEVITKPFRKTDLAWRVRRALDSRSDHRENLEQTGARRDKRQSVATTARRQ